ncbi:Gpr1p SKDI_04G2040 [Saccharomyces kudriavzevii IFO 1802]|uniref:GPR1-like protein n=1 Tax=Saccharomyces kudriavzevii (strain ATCC MYA-4449 / AS 2.2408 / CBS 8840 / NBRC 1802 / NCYC 2889) TaxID=226230 RepID=A0AA35JDQ3_SACK1|nr:uncharacterized protein SKDI_04G2040 [Saccharomyces kudriavzevii IFO 1802]CAI4057713.1 hypothetical protein SKDI_04G2040 [Saccharomyces kudriavzevii IFO 1802]
MSKRSSLPQENANALRQINTTTVNQLLGLPGMTSTFTAPQLLQLRIIAITASAVSLLAGCFGMFFLSKMDKRRKVFRHDLIAFLIICDFLKAFILMVYPMIILIDNSVYAKPAFFNTLGWFTAFAIEGADMAIMIFAIHFAVLIFKPNWKWRNKRSGNMEGGLYKKRSYIWPITALVPAILASLAFINYNKLNDDSETTVVLDNNNYDFPDSPRQGGYKPWSAWCYLPPKPYWYKIVLSWAPRYFIIIFIFAVYLSIYISVTSESKRIKAQIGDFNHNLQEEEKEKKIMFGLGHWGKAKWYFQSYFRSPLLHLLKNLKNFFTISLVDPTEETDDSSSSGTFDLSQSSHEIPTIFEKTKTGSDENVSMNGGVRLLDYNTTKQQDKLQPATFRDPDLEKNDSLDCDNDISLNPLGFMSKQSEHNISFDVENERGDTGKSSVLGHQTFFGPNSLASPFDTYDDDNDNNNYNNKNKNENTKNNSNNSNLADNIPIAHNRALTQYQESSQDTINNKNEDDNSNFTDVQRQFQTQTYQQMKKRRAQIQKNLRAIFIYPLSYIAIWLFPIIADALQYKHEIKHGPSMWVSYIDTCVRPLSCLVDVIVYLFKEKPWNYSWAKTESKYLIEKYVLKGELGEKDIMEFCHSDWGKRGWYYRGKWKKRKCWKYSTNIFKRTIWFIERIFKQLFELKLNFDFYDNCDDFEFWENYYSAKDSSDNKRAESDEIKTNNSDRSLPSNSLELQTMLNSTRSEEVEVPLFWRFIHHIPMLGGIDLDELDRSLKIRYNNDHFSLPGLKFALRRRESQDQGKDVSNDSIVKSSFFSNNVITKNDKSSIEENKNSRYQEAAISENDFSEPAITCNTPHSVNDSQNDSDSNGMDLIAFLKNGPL